MDAEVLLLQVHGNRRVSLFAHSHHWSFKLPLFTWRFTTFLAITFRSCCCCQSNALPWSPCWKCWHTRTLMNICLCRHSIARPQFRLCFATSQVIELNWTELNWNLYVCCQSYSPRWSPWCRCSHTLCKYRLWHRLSWLTGTRMTSCSIFTVHCWWHTVNDLVAQYSVFFKCILCRAIDFCVIIHITVLFRIRLI